MPFDSYPCLLPIGMFVLNVTPEKPELALNGDGIVRLTMAAMRPGNSLNMLSLYGKCYLLALQNAYGKDEENQFDINKSTKKPIKRGSNDKNDLKENEKVKDEEKFEEDFTILSYIVCNLYATMSIYLVQQPIDIVIKASENILFKVVGEPGVQLTGNYVYNPLDEASDETDSDSSDEDSVLKKSDLELNNSDEDDWEMTQNHSSKDIISDTNSEVKVELQSKFQNCEIDFKKEKRVFKFKERQNNTKQKARNFSNSSIKNLGNGITFRDRKIGCGPKAQLGDTISVRYIVMRLDGRAFDPKLEVSNTEGEPYKFVLGVDKVKNDWGMCVVGMAVNGVRRIVIPLGREQHFGILFVAVKLLKIVK